MHLTHRVRLEIKVQRTLLAVRQAFVKFESSLRLEANENKEQNKVIKMRNGCLRTNIGK